MDIGGLDLKFTADLSQLEKSINQVQNSLLNFNKKIEAETSKVAHEAEMQFQRIASTSNAAIQKTAQNVSQSINSLNTQKAAQGLSNLQNQSQRTFQTMAVEGHNAVSTINQDFNSLNSGINKFMAIASVGLGGLSLGSLVSDVINTRGEFQKLESSFETMLGSKEKADKLMEDVKQAAAVTPYDLQGVASASKQLLAYGESSETVIDTLTRLGNVASGIGAPLGDIAYLYGTTMTQGRLYTQDLNQFTGRGIPMIKLLAEQFGVAENKVKELVEAGKVGFPEVKKAIETLTNEGGMFYGLMEKQSASLSGQVARLGDAWDVMMNEIGQSNEGVLSSGISAVGTLIENWKIVVDVLGQVALAYGALKAKDLLASKLSSSETKVKYDAELDALKKLLPEKEKNNKAIIDERLAKGELTQAQATELKAKIDEVEAIKQEIQARYESLKAVNTENQQLLKNANIKLKTAAQEKILAKQRLQLAQSQAKIAYQSGTEEEIAAARKQVQIAKEELLTAEINKQNLALERNNLLQKANASQTALNTFELQRNAVQQEVVNQKVSKFGAMAQGMKNIGRNIASTLSSIVTPANAALVAVTFLVEGIVKLVQEDNALYQAQSRLNDETRKFEVEANKEIASLIELEQTLQSYGEETKEYQDAKKNMLELSEKYNVRLTDENDNLLVQVETMEKLKKAIKETAEQKAYSSFITSEESRRIEKISELAHKAEDQLIQMNEATNPLDNRSKEEIANMNAQIKIGIAKFIQQAIEGNDKVGVVDWSAFSTSFDLKDNKELANALNFSKSFRTEGIINPLVKGLATEINGIFYNLESALQTNEDSLKQIQFGKDMIKKLNDKVQAEQNAEIDTDSSWLNLDELITGIKNAEESIKISQEMLMNYQGGDPEYRKAEQKNMQEQEDLLKKFKETFKSQFGVDYDKWEKEHKPKESKQTKSDNSKLEEQLKAYKEYQDRLDKLKKSNRNSDTELIDNSNFKEVESIKNQYQDAIKAIEDGEKEVKEKLKQSSGFDIDNLINADKGSLNENQKKALNDYNAYLIESQTARNLAAKKLEKDLMNVYSGSTRELNNINTQIENETKRHNEKLQFLNSEKEDESLVENNEARLQAIESGLNAENELYENNQKELNEKLISYLSNNNGYLKGVFEQINAQSQEELGTMLASGQAILQELNNLNVDPEQAKENLQKLLGVDDDTIERIITSDTLRKKLTDQIKAITDKLAKQKIGGGIFKNIIQGFVDLKKANENENNELDKFEQKQAKNKAFQTIVNGCQEATDGIMDLCNSYDVFDEQTKKIIDTSLELIDITQSTIFSIRDIVQSSSAAMVSASTAAATSIQMVEKASVILAIISAVIQAAMAIAKLFSNREKQNNAIEEELKSVEALKKAYNDLIDEKQKYYEKGGHTAQQALQNYQEELELIKKQTDAIREQGKLANDRREKKSNSIQYLQWGDNLDRSERKKAKNQGYTLSWSSIASDISRNTGEKMTSMDSLFDMSAESLKWIKSTYTQYWAQLDDETKDYLEEIIETEKKLEDANSAYITDRLGQDFKGFKDGVLDTLLDIDVSAADVSKNIGENMRKALITNMFNDEFQSKWQMYYDKYKEYYQNDNRLDESEINALAQLRDEISQAQVEKIQGVNDMFRALEGENDTDTLSGALASASQESIDLLAGQTNAVRINQIDMIDIMKEQLIAQVEIQASMVQNNNYLASIDQKLNADNLRASGVLS